MSGAERYPCRILFPIILGVTVVHTMDILEVLGQVRELLQQEGRVSYRILKRQFALDDESLEDLKFELIEVRELATDKDGKMLVWAGDGAVAPQFQPHAQPPASYTPQHLAERIRAEQQAMESRGAADGERKTITALFADLKGSTALIEGLDPEDARAIIDPALQIMMDAVHRYDGYVAQALGDGIFALFGAPIAHEDHPQRALYAALRMQEEMRGYSDQVRLKHGIPLQMRVGINTGEVVVRSIRKDDLHTDYVPVGHSTNLAARMEQMANPGSIVISEYTRKLTEGYFDLKELGAAEIKGVEEPLNVYEVLGAGPLRTRLQVSARRGLSRFVGRHAEMDQLQGALERAKAGHGQIVGVIGEPGLGKSRLFHEFKLTSRSGCLVLEAFAVSHGKGSLYLPLIELLKNYFQIQPADDERTRRQKIIGQVLELDRTLEATLPYLFALLGIEEGPSSLQQMDAQIRRTRTFDAVKQLFLRESLKQPVLLIFEDLHWIDTETQGFLDSLTESVASAQVFFLVNYRPEYRHEWGGKTYYTQLHLAPLGTEEAEELLTFLLGSDASLTQLKPLILDKTEGTPFFMEEVVQTLAEDGGLSGERGHYRLETVPTELHISPTVQGVLAARIDRLTAAEKELLQQLSVIGRQFPVSLVHAVVSQTEDELQQILASLQAKEFLYEQPAFPESEYLFKHALTQDVVYGTLLQEQRKTLHEQTGQAVEALYADSLDEHYGELARHYQLSTNTQKAVEYLDLAGHHAVRRSANDEAIGRFTTAIKLLQTLPETPERGHNELVLQVALGVPLTATKSWAAAEVGQVWIRARELCEQGGDTPETFPTVFGLWAFYLVRAEFKQAHELGEQLLRLAQNAQDSALLLVAHYAMGMTLFHGGEPAPACTHLEQGSALYDAQQHHYLAFSYGSFDPGVACLSNTTSVLWPLGYPAKGLKSSQEAVTLAQDLSHPFSLAYALNSAALVHQLRREGHAARERAEALIALSTEQGFPYFLAEGTMIRGWALAAQGHGAEGISQLREGLAAWQASGTESWRSQFLALLAEAYAKDGQVEEGLSTVAEALAFVERTEERYYEAELHRLQGELLLQQSENSAPAAATSFQQALTIARHQQAKSWELRAATSLARLWQGQGQRMEARDLLAPVYDWFTEGFDTADLKDAQALLEKLA